MQGKKENEEVIKKRPRVLYEQWLKHFAVWQASGQRISEYCDHHNLSVKAFRKQYWKSRQEKTLKKLGSKNSSSYSGPMENFAPVKLVGMQTTATIEFIFKSGVVMKVPASVSLSTVLKSLAVYL